ncbi:MAG: hypothetical protein FWG18_01840 [Alphaproteobacteria bacterium]|nr:hypothetical protein [Alphaproteobacteria bacterium]
MKKLSLFIVNCSLFVALGAPAHAAVTINKAAPVAAAPKSAESAVTGSSLIPTALSMITGVMALNQQVQALTTECKPTQTELTWVTNMMKEYAKTGATDAQTMMASIKRERCVGTNFKDSMQAAAMTTGLYGCVATFNSSADAKMIWQDYPRPSMATICKKNGGFGCTANEEETVSDIYEIYGLIGFGPADLLPVETTIAPVLMEKILKCTESRLAAKQRELWGDFLIQSAGGLGKTGGNLAETLGAVNQIMAGGGATSPMAAIMGMAPNVATGLMR